MTNKKALNLKDYNQGLTAGMNVVKQNLETWLIEKHDLAQKHSEEQGSDSMYYNGKSYAFWEVLHELRTGRLG